MYIDSLLETLREAGSRTVIRQEGVDVSGRELLASISAHASALADHGIGVGRLVAIPAENTPTALAIHHACHVLGAAAVYLPALDDAAMHEQLLAELAPDLVADTATAGALTFRADLEPQVVRGAAGPHDLAVVACSGGTTGVPKGSVRDFAVWSRLVGGPPDPSRRQLINGPLANLSGVLADQTLLAGGMIVLQSGFDAESTLRAIEQEQITDLFVVEPQLIDLVDHADVATRDLSSLRRVTHIGASAPATLRDRARRRLGPIVVHPYAASETGVVSVLSPSDDATLAASNTSAGPIRPGVDVRFRRDDGGVDVRAGIIEIRSAAMAQGYLAGRGAHSFDDGWFITGDRGHLEGDVLHVLGRDADCISVRGTYVGPCEIEDALMQHSDIRYAVAFRDGSSLVVAVTLWTGRRVSASERARIVRDEFGAEVADTMTSVALEWIPTTPQGKPDRRAIVSMLAAGTAGRDPEG